MAFNTWNKICLSSWRRKYNKCALSNTSYWCSLMNNKVICGLHLYVWDYFLHSFLCIYYFTKIKPLPCSVLFSSESWEKWLSWLSCALSPKLFTNNSEKRGTIIFLQILQFSRSHVYENWKQCCRPHLPVPIKFHCSKCFLCLILKGIYLPSSKWIILSLQTIAVLQNGKIPGLLIDSEYSFSCLGDWCCHDSGLYSPFVQAFRFY